jgi:hypothetical protein
MFFGLTNSPPTFQAFMEFIFADYLAEGWLKIYLDDIFIFSVNIEQHKEREMKVLARLVKHDLFLKPEKCAFSVKEVEYLGFIITKGSVCMDPKKLRGITEWETPMTVKEVWSFLGFGNFYSKFIEHFSDKAAPLFTLTKKDVPWNWTSEQQKAF